MDSGFHETLESTSIPGDPSTFQTNSSRVPKNPSAVFPSFDARNTFQEKPDVPDASTNNNIVSIAYDGKKVRKIQPENHAISESTSARENRNSVIENPTISYSDDANLDEMVFQDEPDAWDSLSLASFEKSESTACHEVSETSEESQEENNNDSSSEMETENFADEEIFGLVKENSESCTNPRPSCSKSWSWRVRNEKKSQESHEVNERVREIVGLVSKVTRESILNGVKNNRKIPISELKLWDLLPANERLKFSRINSSRTMTDGFLRPTKRGRNEDICTIDYKRSSLNSDRSSDFPETSSSGKKIHSTSGMSQKLGQFDDIRSSSGSPDVKILDVINVQPINRSVVLEAKVERHKRLVALAERFNASSEKLAKSYAELVGSDTTVKNTTVAPSTSEQLPIQILPKIRIAGQVSNPQQSSISIPKEHQPRSYVRFVVKNQACYAKKDSRLSLSTDRQRNNFQTHAEISQSTNRPVCMDMYYRLRTIFPNVDPDYIKKICPPEWAPGNRDVQLVPLVEHLLKMADRLPSSGVETKLEKNAVETCDDIDGMYENLLGIFPDADPHYLREFAARNEGKPDSLKEFVENKLRSRDYPTREQYMTRLKITEQQRQYTTCFDVKQFLTIIPDPFKHFLDPQRKCLYSTVTFEFLKSYFNKMKVQTISSVYAKSQYNASITAARLADMGFDLKTKRTSCEMPTGDIALLQEIAFVKHKKQLSDYMLAEKTLEENEFRMLKEQNGLVECQCCFDSECVPSKCSKCENGHLFCNNCVRTGTSSKMGDGETRISCFLNCGSEFSLFTLQKVLAPTTASILLKKRQAAEVLEAGLEGLVSCPFCDFASIPPEDDKVFKCLNPECTKESCRLCKELSHVPLRCDEVMKADKARHYIEEKMTQALARTCYKCHRPFFKEEGCNKITCPCGASMCYLCDQPLDNKNYKHFRGQGSDDKKLCPLYSDTIRLNAVAVYKVAEQAQAEIMKINPNVRIDTSKLLPTIPRPTAGPHTTVVNADELPLRVRNVRYEPL